MLVRKLRRAVHTWGFVINVNFIFAYDGYIGSSESLLSIATDTIQRSHATTLARPINPPPCLRFLARSCEQVCRRFAPMNVANDLYPVAL
jgi:hypothetical protein